MKGDDIMDYATERNLRRSIVKNAVYIAIALFIVLVAQNTQVVRVDFLAWSFSISQALFVPLMLLSGAALGLIVGFFVFKKK